MADTKKNFLFGKVESRDDAVKLAKDCGIAFLVVAAIQAAVAYWVALYLFFDAALFALCGYFIAYRHSRVAAVIALLLGLGVVVTTVMNKLGQNVGGGSNVILALIVAAAGIRSVEATFKLRGRFAEPGSADNA